MSEAGVLALIPARSGSRGIPDKNIRDFCGKPLLAHTIEQARACPLVDRVIVSTDSKRYAEIARGWGAETPFLRPAEISRGESTDLECFQHALGWLAQHERRIPALCVHLRPTNPNRTAADITRAITVLREHPEWDSLRSVVPAPASPFKMWLAREDGTIFPAATCDLNEAHSLPRQLLPPAYLTNGSVDVIRSRTIIGKGSIAGDCVGAFVMTESHDIDSEAQFERAAVAFRRGDGLPTRKTFCIDIDGVVATQVPDGDYAKAEPISHRIDIINLLHDRGNRIVLFTARGAVTRLDWEDTTRRQLDSWGLLYDELCFGKPPADFYIDDRMLRLEEFDGMLDLER
ncbi:MAG TPA: acylneuraminate cytidylyltransferase family protein [Thermoanaerobaculia bacterium]